MSDAAAMRTDLRGEPTPGLKGGGYGPELALITGALDPAWRHLAPEHPAYGRWYGAWRLQEEWTPETHYWVWSAFLADWPRESGRATSTGLAASRAAVWQRDGYSQVQIAEALRYRKDGAPKSLWRRAGDYADWLEQADHVERQADLQWSDLDAFDLVAWFELLYASSVDPSIDTGGLRFDTGTPVVDPSAPDAAEQARRWVRRKWRTPRVVTMDEWAQAPFGLPERLSEAILYSPVERQRVERAEQALRAQAPYHARAA